MGSLDWLVLLLYSSNSEDPTFNFLNSVCNFYRGFTTCIQSLNYILPTSWLVLKVSLIILSILLFLLLLPSYPSLGITEYLRLISNSTTKTSTLFSFKFSCAAFAQCRRTRTHEQPPRLVSVVSQQGSLVLLSVCMCVCVYFAFVICCYIL